MQQASRKQHTFGDDTTDDERDEDYVDSGEENEDEDDDEEYEDVEADDDDDDDWVQEEESESEDDDDYDDKPKRKRRKRTHGMRKPFLFYAPPQVSTIDMSIRFEFENCIDEDLRCASSVHGRL
jgi:hypothetical protein